MIRSLSHGFPAPPDGHFSASSSCILTNTNSKGSDSSCSSQESCQAPEFFKEDQIIPFADYKDDFYSSSAWMTDTFENQLTLTDTTYLEDIWYYCYHHSGQTGRIKQLDSAGNALHADPSPDNPNASSNNGDYNGDSTSSSYGDNAGVHVGAGRLLSSICFCIGISFALGWTAL